jgi:two-component system, OmpR family, sensor histidine kinase BaeS
MLRSIRTKTLLVAISVACFTSAVSFVAALIYYERRLEGLPTDIRDQVDRQILANTPDDFDGISELLFATLASAATGAAFGVALTRRHARIIRTVSSAAGELRTGQLSSRAVTRSHRWRDEADQLVDDFNHMAEQLEALEHERLTTSATIAHELRTPVSVLRARLQAHLDGVIEPSPAETQLLHSQTLLLDRLIEDLRTISLSNAHRLTLQRRSTDLTALVGDTIASLRPLDPRPIHFENADPVMANVDPERVRQVVSNLILNAQRHTPIDTVIIVRLHELGDHVTLTIEDTSPDRTAAHSPTHGSGLGLGVVGAIAEAHQGTYSYSDQPKGRRSTVSLPR